MLSKVNRVITNTYFSNEQRHSGTQSEKTILKILNKDKQRERAYHNPVVKPFWSNVPFCFQRRRDGSRAPAISTMELSMAIVNGWKPVTIVTKSPIVDVAGVLDPLLTRITFTTYHNNRLFSLYKDYFPW